MIGFAKLSRLVLVESPLWNVAGFPTFRGSVNQVRAPAKEKKMKSCNDERKDKSLPRRKDDDETYLKPFQGLSDKKQCLLSIEFTLDLNKTESTS